MKLLKKETLRSPQYLVIHTGTNDPHTLRRDTAEAVRKMAEQASKEFPEFRHPHCGQICSNSCSLSPSPPTAAELCCSCSPDDAAHPPSPCYL
ncbi:Ankyrin repeat domain containing protein 24 [Dissostichus eleginoides]|uniref:Ankyrin repeat domain containing protein 24 n=1 Tax=Dissostichus eleginoides TaxID=100907 RepID=A0AAD9F5B9_DISEL|nr:Ankyrin repeat domain containing protein 24 [Dissostichus eleginoides]